jgi:nitrite reductase (NO-forming)
MQGEFYTEPAAPGSASKARTFNAEKATDEKPDFVVFNGSVGALTDAQALQAKVGETVRIFAANGGPNLTSSFHVIGEIFDRVWTEGNTSLTARNVQTTTIPPGGSAIAEFQVKVPGSFLLVDHSLSRAFNKGAMAQLTVTGAEDKTIYSGKVRDEVYAPKSAGLMVLASDDSVHPARTKDERMQAGARVFATNCSACHQASGQGVPNAFPPLASSDYLKSGKPKLIKTVTGGLQGKVTVNGKEYNGLMPAWSLSDEDIANVLTFILNSWGNPGSEVSPADVKTHRASSTPIAGGRAPGAES